MKKGIQLEPTIPDAQAFFAAMEMRIERNVLGKILKEISNSFAELATQMRGQTQPIKSNLLREEFKPQLRYGNKRKQRFPKGVNGWPGSLEAALKLWRGANDNVCQTCHTKAKRLILQGAHNHATKTLLLREAMQLREQSGPEALKRQFPSICKSCFNKKHHIGGNPRSRAVA